MELTINISVEGSLGDIPRNAIMRLSLVLNKTIYISSFEHFENKQQIHNFFVRSLSARNVAR